MIRVTLTNWSNVVSVIYFKLSQLTHKTVNEVKGLSIHQMVWLRVHGRFLCVSGEHGLEGQRKSTWSNSNLVSLKKIPYQWRAYEFIKDCGCGRAAYFDAAMKQEVVGWHCEICPRLIVFDKCPAAKTSTSKCSVIIIVPPTGNRSFHWIMLPCFDCADNLPWNRKLL